MVMDMDTVYDTVYDMFQSGSVRLEPVRALFLACSKPVKTVNLAICLPLRCPFLTKCYNSRFS